MSELLAALAEPLIRLQSEEEQPQLIDTRTEAELRSASRQLAEASKEHPDKGKSCAGCGLCCKLFFLGFDPRDTEQCINMIAKERSLEAMQQSLQDWKFMLRNFRKVDMGPKAWTCAAYDGVNGVCTAYEDRPKLCRSFFCEAALTGGKPDWEQHKDVKAADPTVKWSKLKVDWKPWEANTARQNGYSVGDSSDSNEHDCGVRAAASTDARAAGVHDSASGERLIRAVRETTKGGDQETAAAVCSEEEKMESDMQSHKGDDVFTENA